jgi:hypothetical protein
MVERVAAWREKSKREAKTKARPKTRALAKDDNKKAKARCKDKDKNKCGVLRFAQNDKHSGDKSCADLTGRRRAG